MNFCERCPLSIINYQLSIINWPTMVLACGGKSGTMAGGMTFLPVVERELRVASRRRGTYWGRLIVGRAGLAAAALILLGAQHVRARAGEIVFKVLAAL